MQKATKNAATAASANIFISSLRYSLNERALHAVNTAPMVERVPSKFEMRIGTPTT